MKTRKLISALALLAAGLAGMAVAQVPVVSEVLAPLSGGDRAALVDTLATNAVRERWIASMVRVYSPSAEQYFLGRASAFEQAAYSLRTYGSSTAPQSSR